MFVKYNKWFWAARRRNMLHELFPDWKPVYTKGSDEDAQRMAERDIRSENWSKEQLRKEWKKQEKAQDKNIGTMWWPDSQYVYNYFKCPCNSWDGKDEYDTGNIIKDLRKLRNSSNEHHYWEWLGEQEKWQKLYRKFLVFNKPIDENVWTIEQFLKMWFMKVANMHPKNTDYPDSRYTWIK